MARRKEQVEQRPGCHDELVAHLLRKFAEVDPSVLNDLFGFGKRLEKRDPGYQKKDFRIYRTTTEKSLGRGFVDIFLEAVLHYRSSGEYRNRSVSCCILIEVKSNRENWTAGDVLRQLKNYRKVVENQDDTVLAFFSERALTEAEKFLFDHEGVVVLSP